MVAGMLGMFFFLTQFLQGTLGYSPLKTGFAFIPLTAMLFLASTLSARVLVERIGSRALITGGITLSTGGLLWLTQLSETSNYLSVLGPLLLFGLGNGIAFVPLTTAALDGVAPEDAGAASGLVNVMQQLGGSLGLAVLVTVFGTASTSAARHARPGQTAAEVARHAFVVGADRAFLVATILLAATALLTWFAIRPPAQQETDTQASNDTATVAA
jgi:fucose permease